jgi:hypothetical protein
MRFRLAGTALLVASVFSSTASAQELGPGTGFVTPYGPFPEPIQAPSAPPAPTDEVIETANEAGVDPIDLQGAVNTTGMSPKDYAYAVGDLQRPKPTLPVASASSSSSSPSVAYGVWDRLAGCEASGIWSRNTGNGYYGGLQEDMTFWRNYGGTQYAARPDLASRDAQIAVAQRGLAAQGWGAWPRCSRILGLR